MLDRAQNLTKHSETQRRRDSGNVGVGFHSLSTRKTVLLEGGFSLGVDADSCLRGNSIAVAVRSLDRSTQPTRLSINNRQIPYFRLLLSLSIVCRVWSEIAEICMGALSGSSIAFAIHSVNPSLFGRLIPAIRCVSPAGCGRLHLTLFVDSGKINNRVRSSCVRKRTIISLSRR